MSFDTFLAQDQQLIDELHSAPDRDAVISKAMAEGEQALVAAASLAEQVEITMRLAATAALGAQNSPDLAEAAVVWAARCGRLVRGPAGEAHYLPRLASLVGAVMPSLSDEARRVVVAGMPRWLDRAARAIETVTHAEREGDSWARVALAAETVAGAEDLAMEARRKANEAYARAGGLTG